MATLPLPAVGQPGRPRSAASLIGHKLSELTKLQNVYAQNRLVEVHSFSGVPNADTAAKSGASDDKTFSETWDKIEALRQRHDATYSSRKDGYGYGHAEMQTVAGGAAASDASRPAKSTQAEPSSPAQSSRRTGVASVLLSPPPAHTYPAAVQQRLALIRGDASERHQLEARVAQHQVARRLAKAQSQRDYVAENREAVKAMSAATTSLGAGRRRSAERAASTHASHSEHPASARGGERRARAEQRLGGNERRLASWKVLVALAKSGQVWLDAIERYRSVKREAVRTLEAQASAYIFRRRVRRLGEVLAWFKQRLKRCRERIKHRAADRLREFLEECIERAKVARAIREFCFKAVLVQRGWRAAQVVHGAQLAVQIRQFDRLARSKPSVDAFLTGEALKSYSYRVGPKLKVGVEAAAGKGGKARKKGKGALAPAVLNANGVSIQRLAFSDGKFLELDFVARAEVLKVSLRERRRELLRRVAEWAAERERLIVEELEPRKEIEAARRMVNSSESSHVESAEDDEKWLRERLPPYPRFQLIVSGSFLAPLVVEVIERTGEKIVRDEPIILE